MAAKPQYSVLKALLLSAIVGPLSVSAQTTLIPTSCFNDQSSLQSYFSYNYPWGDTHNGAAIMTSSHEVASGGVLTLTSSYTGASDYAWTSGTVYAKQHFSVSAGGGLDFTAQFIAPVAKGTWPAFWLTATSGWPPEIDIAEWKGNGDISFNTFNTSSQVASSNIAYPSPTSWHTVLAQLRDAGNGKDVRIQFYLDGALKATQVGAGYIGKGFYLIIDYQMEGSSGSPGPHSTTKFQVRNLKVTSYN
ncbi:concanavalin A-like lectin/glucanase domain-containing protein [Xylogone sp. PMI_703]|nr:concanavalin A-like lectin/glucanase domain-containing protein [Xylogone sp. PMI_703]